MSKNFVSKHIPKVSTLCSLMTIAFSFLVFYRISDDKDKVKEFSGDYAGKTIPILFTAIFSIGFYALYAYDKYKNKPEAEIVYSIAKLGLIINFIFVCILYSKRDYELLTDDSRKYIDILFGFSLTTIILYLIEFVV
jgi:amino acid transporter